MIQPISLGLLLVTAAAVARPLPEYRVALAPPAAAALLAGDAEAWSAAQAVTWGAPPWTTDFRALYDARGLWLRFDVADDSPWHTHTARDAPLWEQEVVEIFLDPDGDGANYAELEISPANVVTDLVVFAGWPTMDTDAVWSLAGLRTGVVRGDEGWTALAFVPWAALAALPHTDASLPPRAGDAWRANLFRIKRPGGPREPERDAVYSAWSPVPGASFHVPEAFGWLRFGSE